MAPNLSSSDFETVYRAHFATVRRFAYHLVQDDGLADELSQDSFVRALHQWDNFRGEAPVQVWLLRIARNVCLDYLRSPRSRVAKFSSLEPGTAADEDIAVSLAAAGEPPPPVEQAARQAEMAECVQAFVFSLPETLRTPLLLHETHGLTAPEIAQVLGCSLQAAKMRLHRARGQLKQMMEERCDLFHDERNVLSCLPGPAERQHPTFISSDDIALAARRGAPEGGA